MPCQHVAMPAGGVAIVCGSHRRQRCACGRPATLLCDWRTPTKRSGTCDAPICTACSMSPAPEKDLCRSHAREFDLWRAKRETRPETRPVDGVML